MSYSLLRMLSRLSWLVGEPEPSPPEERQPMLPEEIEEERLMHMDMHYGDEPLYCSDPPQWPHTPWTP